MEKTLSIKDYAEAQVLFGSHDENLKEIEREFKVRMSLRSGNLKISGTATNIRKASDLIEYLLDGIRQDQVEIGKSDLTCLISNFKKKEKNRRQVNLPEAAILRLPSGRQMGPKTKGQREYVEAIKKQDIVFGIGPAGTGKTYLAMMCAVEALKMKEVRRIILTRPAIEAGESLGYLPGDIYEKISPYLRPLYDALYDMMDAEVIEKYLETGIIEVAPLAYMRGRTLNDAFIILDEAQNCT
ncbi:MAG: PhoH family protein, partial [Candidatus Omnitrophica bacterium]|nr:PhoH family protein [Candidatus Omnitrophota bacterium]